jgi:hypothetical protein
MSNFSEKYQHNTNEKSELEYYALPLLKTESSGTYKQAMLKVMIKLNGKYFF